MPFISWFIMILLFAVLTCQRAAALSLMDIQPATPASTAFHSKLKPQVKLPIPHNKPLAKSPYLNLRMNQYRKNPEPEIIRDDVLKPVRQNKKSIKKDLSRYLSSEPIKEQADYGSNSQNAKTTELMKQKHVLEQNIQSICSQYMKYLESSNSREMSAVSDTTLELIMYLCDEFLHHF